MRHVYYLEFDDPSGTDRRLFATFRPHHAWAKRLRPGRVVMLANTKTRQVYGKAKVVQVHAGKMDAILKSYGWQSHLEELLVCEEPEAHHRHMLACAKRRFASMQKRYGPNRITHDTNVTAIILHRVPDKKATK